MAPAQALSREGGPVDAAVQAPPAPTRMTATAAPSPILVNQRVEIGGMLELSVRDAAGSRYEQSGAGGPIGFWFRANGSRSWVYKGTDVTTDDGRVARVFRQSMSGTWQLRWDGSTFFAPSTASVYVQTVSTARATACTGASHCRITASVDVDGDRRKDQVGLARVDPGAAEVVVVRVKTASGRILATSAPLEQWGSTDAWLGATALDGVPGAELVVGALAGAHTQYFRVVTYRKGALVTLASPQGGHWVVDGSYSMNQGYERSVTKGAVHVRLSSAARVDANRHQVERTTYRWTSRGWVPLGAASPSWANDKTAFALAGWRVGGLPRFA